LWKNGKQHGKGKLVMADGRIKDGFFIENKF
jgi:hypothetical protein